MTLGAGLVARARLGVRAQLGLARPARRRRRRCRRSRSARPLALAAAALRRPRLARRIPRRARRLGALRRRARARAALARAGDIGGRHRRPRGARPASRDVIDRADWIGVGPASRALRCSRSRWPAARPRAARPAVGGARPRGSPARHSSRRCRMFSGRAGLAAGTLYAAGDVATKAAVFGGAWLADRAGRARGARPRVRRAPARLPARRRARDRRAASLLTNALPIAAGVVLFHEHLPGGALGVPSRRRLRARGRRRGAPCAAASSRCRVSRTTRSAISSTRPGHCRRNVAS